ncbi:aspartate carbamoyltransferase [Candidatus Parcubacteria bacterium]|nr:MAG: aspartate carbamoyltransferase [Candidatus Parcubacteria bacterium]
MKLEHLISTKQFRFREELREIFETAGEMEKREKSGKFPPDCSGKILATVFYEPSTRTRFSFETAMYKLGGNVITSENAAEFSSAKKGESLEDSMRVISGYADAIVLRHPEEGSALRASKSARVPLINAGDGSGEHPTQALLDLYTAEKELARLDDISIAFVGDLKYSRTIHSTLYLLPLYRNIRVCLVSPPQLKLPEEYEEYLREKNIPFEEVATAEEAAGRADILSVTRIQQERFASREEYERLKGSYVINKKVLDRMKKDSIIMHPLPRVSEIAPEVDEDARAAYFRQTKNGVYVRMALLKMMLLGS